jgi:Kef-type K+ transport system membrane component KefB
MTVLVLQLAVIIIFSKTFGYLTVKFLKQPSVLGELVAGMIIGPFALGSIALPFLHGQPLFAIPHGSVFPVSPELYGFATVASIVLLFISGLETDLKTFLRFAGTGSLVGLGGVAATFFLGAESAVLFIPSVTSIMDPVALFMGIISTATSVGISARILSEKHKLSSPEGVTILSAAVFDDVLGIILLAVVVGLVRKEGDTAGSPDWGLVGVIALKAFGFWVGSTVIGILMAPRFVKKLKGLKDLGTLALISLGLALLLAGFSELAGLAMIIGAYVMGLALSSTDVAEDIRHRLEGLYNFIVPVFFTVMGMLVDFSVIPRVIVYGLVYSVIGIVGKVIGCGTPALFAGFNLKGAFRVGAGMLPRGEVTLIMASLGLTAGVLDSGLFGVAVISMLVSSVTAPPVLVRAFRGGSGFKKKLETKDNEGFASIDLELPSESLADFVLYRLLDAFRQAEFFPRHIGAESPVYAVQKDDIRMIMYRENSSILVETPPAQESFVRLLLAEEILELKDLFRHVEEMTGSNALEQNMLSSLFADAEDDEDTEDDAEDNADETGQDK